MEGVALPELRQRPRVSHSARCDCSANGTGANDERGIAVFDRFDDLAAVQLDRNALIGAVAACQEGRASIRAIQAGMLGASASDIPAGLA